MLFRSRHMAVSSASEPVFFACRCRKCGRIVSVWNTFTVEKGCLANWIGYDRAGEIASERAKEAFTRELPGYLSKINKGHVFPANANLCPACRKRVARGDWKWDTAAKVTVAMFFVSFILSGLSLSLSGRPDLSFMPYAVPAACVLPWIIALIRNIIVRAKNDRFAAGQGDKMYYPLAATAEGLDPESDDPRMHALILRYAPDLEERPEDAVPTEGQEQYIRAVREKAAMFEKAG